MNQTKIDTNSWHYKLIKNKIEKANTEVISQNQYIFWVVLQIALLLVAFSIGSSIAVIIGSGIYDLPGKTFEEALGAASLFDITKAFFTGWVVMLFALGLGYLTAKHDDIFSSSKKKVQFVDKAEQRMEELNKSDKL